MGAAGGVSPAHGGPTAQAKPGARGDVEHMLRQVAPGRLDSYEALLRSLADGQVWMLLWHGTAGSPDAQYGNMEVEGLGYAPCVTSAQELSASGWNRAHELTTGRDIARSLFPDRWGIWLNPHAPGGGVGIPWLDLRRIATGLDRMPAGRSGSPNPPSRSRSSTPCCRRTPIAPPPSGPCAARGSSPHSVSRTSRSGSTSTTPDGRPSTRSAR